MFKLKHIGILGHQIFLSWLEVNASYRGRPIWMRRAASSISLSCPPFLSFLPSYLLFLSLGSQGFVSPEFMRPCPVVSSQSTPDLSGWGKGNANLPYKKKSTKKNRGRDPSASRDTDPVLLGGLTCWRASWCMFIGQAHRK